MTNLPEITRQHLEQVRDFYDAIPARSKWSGRGYRRQLAH
jgi:hypothetical protein